MIELIVVIGIIAVISSISVFQFRKGQIKQDLVAAADDISAAWQEIQTRALAGTATPSDAAFGYQKAGVEPAGNLNTGSYTFLIYGTDTVNTDINNQQTGNFPLFFALQQYTNPDGSAGERINPAFKIMACANPTKNVLVHTSIDNKYALCEYDGTGCNGCRCNPAYRELYGNDWYKYVCWVPLPSYSPILPNSVIVDATTLKLAASVSSLPSAPFNVNDYGYISGFNYDTCTPGTCHGSNCPAYDATSAPKDSFAISIIPPGPQYSVQGKQGCRIVQFALKSTSDSTVKIYMRLDLNTGRITYADTEAQL